MKTDLSGVDIVFDINQSTSMDYTDPNYYRLKAVKRFVQGIDKLKNRAVIVEFSDYATVKQVLTSDKTDLNNSLDNMKYTIGSTNFGAGLNSSEQLFDNAENLKVVILLTDGGNNTGYTDDQVLNLCRNLNLDNDITVNTVALGVGANEALLQGMAGEGNGEYYFINNTEGITQEQVDAQIEMLYIQLVNQLILKKKNMWDIKPIIPDDTISKIKQNLVKLGYTNAETNFDGEVSNFLNEYYLGEYLLKDYYVEIEDNAKTVSLLDWTNRALLSLISKNKLDSISNYEKFQNFSLGILMALGNNGIDTLNVLTAALNSISGPEYASYNYRIMKEYKENGIKAIESNVTDPIAYNAGKVITDTVLVAVGITGAVGSVSLITAGLTGEVASAAAEIFSFGTATPAVACTVAVSTAAVAVGAAGVEASLVLAVNAGKNGIGDAVDLINAIKSGKDATEVASKVNNLIDKIPNSLKKYGKCDEFAKALVEGLKNEGIDYKVINSYFAVKKQL